MKSQTNNKFTCPDVRSNVLPANSAAYVAKLVRNPAQARDFLVRAGITKSTQPKPSIAPKRAAKHSKLTSVAA